MYIYIIYIYVFIYIHNIIKRTLDNAIDSAAIFIVLVSIACSKACVAALLDTRTVKEIMMEGARWVEVIPVVTTSVEVMFNILPILFEKAV